MSVDFDVTGHQEMDFFLLEEVILWIDIFFLARSNVLKLKRLNIFVSWKYNFSLHKTLTDVLES